MEENSLNLERWAREFFTAVDSRQPDRIIQFMHPDVRLQMANSSEVRGSEAVKQGFVQAAERFTSIRHDIRGIWKGMWSNGPVVSVEAIVEYQFPDGQMVSLPCTSTLRLRDDKIADYRIFIDPAPAFS